MSAVSYRPRYTIEDYVLWEGDWELWDGLPVSMSPSPGFAHQRVARQLLLHIHPQLNSDRCEKDCEIIAELDWRVSTSTVVRPDGMIVCDGGDEAYLSFRPDLAVEILSPSTREKDLVAKRELYAVEGVPFYLLIDPEERSLVLLARDEAGVYREIPAEKPFDLHPGCTLQFDGSELFA